MIIDRAKFLTTAQPVFTLQLTGGEILKLTDSLRRLARTQFGNEWGYLLPDLRVLNDLVKDLEWFLVSQGVAKGATHWPGSRSAADDLEEVGG
jgi:hypothetical protein